MVLLNWDFHPNATQRIEQPSHDFHHRERPMLGRNDKHSRSHQLGYRKNVISSLKTHGTSERQNAREEEAIMTRAILSAHGYLLASVNNNVSELLTHSRLRRLGPHHIWSCDQRSN